ncbi:LysM peptidoglycan-binding domain-containing protein [Pyxidicoccus xibeiensis]|uniref:LysM peptidoglycan-binding domain-containing protein n=1 Tax=Pyxidicoccus xibeiensis TaxID=2906759 RepID=UPI0020A7447C|nr:penicillin-insensitive murein endopeptidase [Pyxidicoccus xibeiensis]MCP3143515.1 penicillin-insensitive murein endopeptidase [Pyxidicoccus xibeiensis]
MRYPIWLLLVCAGCAARVSPTAGTAPALAAARSEVSDAARAERPPDAALSPVTEGAVAATPAAGAPDASEGCALSAEDLEGEEDTAEGEGGDVGEGELTEVPGDAVPTGPLYTAEISEEELTRRWKDEIASLGSMAVGFVHSGRLVNAKPFPKGPDWIVVSPEVAWATEETVNYLAEAIREVRARFPEAPPLRVNGMSNKEGGYLRPHKSHQNGRDVDVGFYYPTAEPIRERERERYINVPLNWAFLKALVTKTDVQMVLVDRRVRQVIYNHALAAGEDKAWLDSLFNDGPTGVIRHARRHRDHFHIRFHNARAQELGRRVQPLLALQPEHNVTVHRIRNGDTLGGIALRYGSTVASIKKANRMRNNFLRAGQRLSVPLRGPCTHCPVPPPFLLPPRRLPPEAPALAQVAAKAEVPAASECAKPAPAPANVAVPVVAKVSAEAPAAVAVPVVAKVSAEAPAAVAVPVVAKVSAEAPAAAAVPVVAKASAETPAAVAVPAVAKEPSEGSSAGITHAR